MRRMRPVPLLDTVAPFAALVLLLFWMGFFTLGSLPLMVLKHDTPQDARFVRGFFDVHYKAVMAGAGLGTVAHTAAGRWITMVELLAVCAVAWSSRPTSCRAWTCCAPP